MSFCCGLVLSVGVLPVVVGLVFEFVSVVGVDDAGELDGLDDSGLLEVGLDEVGLEEVGLLEVGLDEAGLDDCGLLDDPGLLEVGVVDETGELVLEGEVELVDAESEGSV